MTLITSTPKTPKWLHPVLWLVVCVLLALVQIQWAGYQLGVGNQGIQIAFLEKLHNGELFKQDQMVQNTLGDYPSYFFHLCAKMLGVVNFPTLYVWLHILATTGVFAAVAALSRGITRNSWSIGLCFLILLAGHHQALAGETLYSPGFTHTWAIFPLSLLALYLFFRDLHAMAFLLVGLIFNFHALEAGHLILIMGFAAVCDLRRVGFVKLLVATGLFLLAAMPTIVRMISIQRGEHVSGADAAQWLSLMHIRSADHSFPTTWWSDGNPILPRFAAILGLAAVGLSFKLPPAMKKRTLLLTAGIGILFVAGTVFTEVWPLPVAIRAQFFRSSRLLFILAAVVIANGCAVALAMPWRRTRIGAGSAFPVYEGTAAGKLTSQLPAWQAWLEFGSAVLTLGALAIPPDVWALPLALLPVVLVVAVVVALVSGRLAWYEALFAGGMLLVCLVASQTIHFSLGLRSLDELKILLRVNFAQMPGFAGAGPNDKVALLEGLIRGLGLMVVACGLAVVALKKLKPAVLISAAAVGVVVMAGAMVGLVPSIAAHAEPDPNWAEAQKWAAKDTPKDALFLTPTMENNAQLYSFRVFSERSVVGEWRDGTQLYFSQDYAKDWWKRMNALQPGMVVTSNGKDRINRGVSLDKLEDESIIALAKSYNASYIVLPTSNQHFLEKAYSNQGWTIYKPKFATPEGMPSDASLPEEDKFLAQRVYPAIEKNRKSDAKLTLVDGSGKPLAGSVTVVQTRSAFGFGSSISFFKQPSMDISPDYKAPAVTPPELDRFKEIFNYSVIPFSGQWRFMEPVQDKVDYTDLDQYIDFCTTNNVRAEFRFVSGYQPAWLRNKISNDQGTFILKRAETLAKRYGGKIKDWQIISEDIGLKSAAQVFARLHQLLPDARLGLADDTRFWSPKQGTAAATDMQRGIISLRDLKKQGVKIDYFAMEAKHPFGLWASGKQIYDLLDLYAAEGVKLHITELGVAVGDNIEGTVRDGKWTEKSQADYYERFFTICYGHPNVEAINVMGLDPKIWLDGQGLLNDKYEPTAAFTRLKELITGKWRTRISEPLSNGQISFRGYQGSYDVTVTLPNGKTAKGSFEVVDLNQAGVSTGANTIRFTLDESAGALKKAGD